MLMIMVVAVLLVHDGNAVNIALGKKCKQSSTYDVCYADLAVNGEFIEYLSPDPKFRCTHTFDPVYPWWAIDLGDTYTVSNVLVYGRTDCCSDRLQNFDIEVIMEPHCACDKWATFHRGVTTLCYHQPTDTISLNATCPPNTVGRFVRIQLKKHGVITLCEVEINGDLYAMATVPKPGISNACGFIGQEYNGITLQTTFAKSKIECVDHCLKQQQCCAAEFQETTNECTLDSKVDTDEETTHSILTNLNKTTYIVT